MSLHKGNRRYTPQIFSKDLNIGHNPRQVNIPPFDVLSGNFQTRCQEQPFVYNTSFPGCVALDPCFLSRKSNTEILTVTIKANNNSQDKILRIGRYDNILLLVQAFCSNNTIPAILVKPLILQISKAMHHISSVYNTGLNAEQAKRLYNIQTFCSKQEQETKSGYGSSAQAEAEDSDSELENITSISECSPDHSDVESDLFPSYKLNKSF